MKRICATCALAWPSTSEFCCGRPCDNPPWITGGDSEACGHYEPIATDEDALEGTIDFARKVARRIAANVTGDRPDPTRAFQDMHTALAAVYMLAYEAGRVQGMAGTMEGEER